MGAAKVLVQTCNNKKTVYMFKLGYCMSSSYKRGRGGGGGGGCGCWDAAGQEGALLGTWDAARQITSNRKRPQQNYRIVGTFF